MLLSLEQRHMEALPRCQRRVEDAVTVHVVYAMRAPDLLTGDSIRRMLKLVSVTGTQDGEPVQHEYSYINFRPYVAPTGAFEVWSTTPFFAVLLKADRRCGAPFSPAQSGELERSLSQ